MFPTPATNNQSIDVSDNVRPGLSCTPQNKSQNNQEHLSICLTSALGVFLFSAKKFQVIQKKSCLFANNVVMKPSLQTGHNKTNVPAASMKARFRRNVRRGSFRFLRKSLRRPVIAWMSSTLLSTGTVLLRRNFSFSSLTVRSAPDRRYRPA